MLTRNLFGPRDFPLAASLAAHRTGIDLHRHDSVELALVTQGHATHRLQSEAYAIEAGDAFVILPNVLHGYENCRSFSVMNLGFDPERLTMPTHQLAALPGYRALFMLEPQVRTKHAFRSRLQLERSALDRVLAIVASLQRELQERAPGCSDGVRVSSHPRIGRRTAETSRLMVREARAGSSSASPKRRNGVSPKLARRLFQYLAKRHL